VNSFENLLCSKFWQFIPESDEVLNRISGDFFIQDFFLDGFGHEAADLAFRGVSLQLLVEIVG